MTGTSTKTIARLGFIGLFGLAEAALACSVLPESFRWTGDQLISRSHVIALVTFVDPEIEVMEGLGIRREIIRLKLKLVEALKGDPDMYLEAIGERGRREAGNHRVEGTRPEWHHADDFDNHSDARFWDQPLGRSPSQAAACSHGHTFVEGETYLLFLDAMSAAKSAEIIRHPDDEWLAHVRSSLATQERNRTIFGILFAAALAVPLVNFARRRTTSGTAPE